MGDDENLPLNGLTFRQFKDWAFLGIIAGMISILVAAIYDLDRSVKLLSERLSEKSGEITLILEQQRTMNERITNLERRH